jgi:dTDP-4-dehydrorhamnose 3,5-epimerase
LKIRETSLPSVFVIEPAVFADERGFFMETWRLDRFRDLGIDVPFVQDNHSRSSRGVLRGLHFQEPHAQGKLIRCVRGSIFDVAVDVRRGSPTFSRWFGVDLTEDNRWMMWVPPGFAHGFLTLSDAADVTYKCTDYYEPSSERSILWNDPDIGIVWPAVEARLSKKDAAAPRLKAAEMLPSYP